MNNPLVTRLVKMESKTTAIKLITFCLSRESTPSNLILNMMPALNIWLMVSKYLFTLTMNRLVLNNQKAQVNFESGKQPTIVMMLVIYCLHK